MIEDMVDDSIPLINTYLRGIKCSYKLSYFEETILGVNFDLFGVFCDYYDRIVYNEHCSEGTRYELVHKLDMNLFCRELFVKCTV